MIKYPLHMLTKNSKYIYFFLLFLFLFLCWVSLVFTWEKLSVNFMYIFTILLLPVFDYILNSIRNEFDPKILSFDSLSLFKVVLFLIIAGSLYLKWYSLAAIWTLLFLVLFLLFDFGSKIPFFIALVLFLYSAIYIVSGQAKIADSLSIYAYYFLIIGVVLQIYRFYLIKFIPSEQK